MLSAATQAASASRSRRRWFAIGALALAIHLATFALLPALLRLDSSDDLRLFFGYGQRMATGQIPYRDFPLEYPPLAALAFWLPASAGAATSFNTYRVGFGLEMAVCNLVTVLAALWAWRRHLPHQPPIGILVIWPLWVFIAGQSLALERFDVWPAALVVLAVALQANGRTRLGWLVVGLGAASKLYPLLLIPLFLIAQRGTRARRQVAADFLACGAAILLPAFLITRGDLLAVRGFLDYHLARGLEIESLYASVLLLGRFFGGDLDWAFRHGSIELIAPQAELAASLALPLSLLAIGACYALAWRTWPRAVTDDAMFPWLVRASLATITAFVIFGKVLSPQYLLWLIPLAALVPSQRGLRVWAALTLVLLLTRCVNPLLWNDLSTFDLTAIIVLLVRNLALCGFLFAVVLPLRDAPDRVAQASSAFPVEPTLQREPAAR